MSEPPEKILEDVVREDGRYPLQAFGFLHEGLRRAVKGVHGDAGRVEGPHHVSGAQLCYALRDEALQRWGMMARMVLSRWNINSTTDFGNMVYLLVENDLMHKTEQDSLEDFRDVSDFAGVFGPETAFESGEK
ncbi:hypothetical protein LCGC14_1562110 [marine sediment metagenome]|uniref:Uncharacterized protein n=1 Tax=marine sediment metagenome TaxID=412755 RepID=A0A0F9IM66_9ZZZZ